jgi:hypothetical protein
VSATLTGQVLRWAADPRGAPPYGPLWDAVALTRPGNGAAAALAALTAVTAARLGAGNPPFGDTRPVGPGALLIATAIGIRRDPAAMDLLRLTPPVRMRDEPWADCIARHAVGGALTAHPGVPSAEFLEVLLELSPLTAVLHRPPRAGADVARAATHALLTRPSGGELLTAAIAAPSADPLVQAWRAELAATLRLEHPRLAVTAYLRARLWHGAQWDEQIAAVRQDLLGRHGPSRLTIEVLRFWLPLGDLARADRRRQGLAAALAGPAARAGASLPLRELHFLDHHEYAEAISLAERYRSVLAVPPRQVAGR